MSMFRLTRHKPWLLTLCLVSVGLCAVATLGAQQPGTENGEWRYWGGDAWSSHYSALDQIDASNFEELEVAWVWKGDNFGPSADNILRATPIYVNGRLYSVAGQRRTVIAIDPATGETLWTFREPPTKRWEDSMRKNYGKGVAYSEVDGDGRIFVVTPAFMLHALDPDTGNKVEGFGDKGTVDLLADLGYDYHPTEGLPADTGYITNSSPPHRRQRRRCRRERARAGLQPDASRECAGPHPGLRRHRSADERLLRRLPPRE